MLILSEAVTGCGHPGNGVGLSWTCFTLLPFQGLEIWRTNFRLDRKQFSHTKTPIQLTAFSQASPEAINSQ